MLPFDCAAHTFTATSRTSLRHAFLTWLSIRPGQLWQARIEEKVITVRIKRNLGWRKCLLVDGSDERYVRAHAGFEAREVLLGTPLRLSERSLIQRVHALPPV